MNLKEKLMFSFLKPKYNITIMDGGFGSQLGQWLFGKWLEYKSGVPTKFDCSFFKTNGMDLNKKFTRNYDLEKVFGVNVPKAPDKEIEIFKKNYPFDNRGGELITACDEIENFNPPKYFGGYYYFMGCIKEIFGELKKLQFNKQIIDDTKIIADEIDGESCPIACHIRRGDYVDSIFDIVSPDYTRGGVIYLFEKYKSKNPIFYFFSNDMDYVRQNILSKLPDMIRTKCIEENGNNTGYNDFYLITRCKHYIASNSSFILAAFFIENFYSKDIIIPEIWLKGFDGKPHHFESFSVMKNDGSGFVKEVCNENS